MQINTPFFHGLKGPNNNTGLYIGLSVLVLLGFAWYFSNKKSNGGPIPVPTTPVKPTVNPPTIKQVNP